MQKLYNELKANEIPVTGFYTQELRENQIRVGFQISSFQTAKSAVVAHVNFSSTFRVGKYGVDTPTFESVAIPGMMRFNSTTYQQELKSSTSSNIYIIDEIGTNQ